MIPLNMRPGPDRTPGRISVVLPSRKRPEKLARSLQSLHEKLVSKSYRAEILVAHDPDDYETVETVEASPFEHVRSWCSPGRYGYGGIANYYAPLLEMSKGEWILFWGDDAVMQTYEWDAIVRSQNPGVLYTRGNPDGHNCFPIVHHSIFQATKRFTGLPAVDTWYDEVGRWSGRWADPGITILQDRPDLTGVEADATYNEGRAGYRAAEYYNPYWTAMRKADATAVFNKLGPEGARTPGEFILEPVTDVRLTMDRFGFVGFGDMLKHPHDLVRYERAIHEDKPEVIVECGTRSGASALWFANQGIDVVTVDIDHGSVVMPFDTKKITMITGSSTDPGVVAKVKEAVAGRRCMVSLDSDHTYAHVLEEIELYAPMVSSGCRLVVEDGIFRYATPQEWERWHFGDYKLGNPLDAIEDSLLVAEGSDFWRDVEIESGSPITHHVGGWWKRS